MKNPIEMLMGSLPPGMVASMAGQASAMLLGLLRDHGPTPAFVEQMIGVGYTAKAAESMWSAVLTAAMEIPVLLPGMTAQGDGLDIAAGLRAIEGGKA